MNKRGRPPMPKGQAKAEMMALRLQPAELQTIQVEAAKAGQDVSEWVRKKLLGGPPAAKVTRTMLEFGSGEYRMRVDTPSPLPRDQWEVLVSYVTDVLKPEEVGP